MSAPFAATERPARVEVWLAVCPPRAAEPAPPLAVAALVAAPDAGPTVKSAAPPNVALCGLPPALSAKSTTAVKSPPVAGSNVTDTAQLPPGATVCPLYPFVGAGPKSAALARLLATVTLRREALRRSLPRRARLAALLPAAVALARLWRGRERRRRRGRQGRPRYSVGRLRTDGPRFGRGSASHSTTLTLTLN